MNDRIHLVGRRSRYANTWCGEVANVRDYMVFFVLALILAVATVVLAVLAVQS